MKHGKFWSLACGIAVLAAALPAAGADLLSVYDRALENDPQIREAEATRRADREARPQALAALLPGLSASANAGRSWSSGSGYSERPVIDELGNITIIREPNSGSGSGNSMGWSLSLSQTVFSMSSYMSLVSSNRQVALAETSYTYAQQQLVQRVAQQYFAVLQAQDSLRAQEAGRDAYAHQFEQAEQKFEVGLIAITEVQENRAARDSANADVIDAKRRLASAEEQLRATIGELPGALNEPTAAMPLLSPDPESQDAWVAAALDQNLNLVAASLNADLARDNVKSSYNGLLPSLNLSASKSFSDSDSDRSGLGNQTLSSNSKSRSESIGLSISMNLNGLGYGNSSRTRQAQQRWIAAKERLERTTRDTERQTRDAYLGVMSEISRVQALQQALESSRVALEATEAGYEVGTRTAVDVLNSRRALILAETQFSAAKYSYLNNLITLRLAAGNLDRSVLEQINSWLAPPPAPAP